MKKGRLREFSPLAEWCFDTSIQLAPKNADLLYNVGLYWLWMCRYKSNERTGENESAGKRTSLKCYCADFQPLFKQALKTEPELLDKVIDAVWKNCPDKKNNNGMYTWR